MFVFCPYTQVSDSGPHGPLVLAGGSGWGWSGVSGGRQFFKGRHFCDFLFTSLGKTKISKVGC